MYSKLSKRRCAQELLAYEDEYSDDERFLFEPSFGPKHPRTKHQEFMEYLKEGVEIADITAKKVEFQKRVKVEFQKRVNIIPGQCVLYFPCTSTITIAYVESQGEIEYQT